MALEDHKLILTTVRSDRDYARQFEKVFGKKGKDITLTEVTQAIAAAPGGAVLRPARARG